MQSAEPHPIAQLMSEVAQGRIQDILKEVPRAKVMPEEDEGGQATLNVEVAGRPIFREFVLASLDVRTTSSYCRSWSCGTLPSTARPEHARKGRWRTGPPA